MTHSIPTTWEAYTTRLPSEIPPAVLTSYIISGFLCYFDSASHISPLRGGAVAALASIIDSALTPIIHTNTYPQIGVITRSLITIYTLYTCGAPLILLNNILFLLSENITIQQPQSTAHKTYNIFVQVLGMFLLSKNPLKRAAIRAAMTAVICCINECIQPTIERIYNYLHLPKAYAQGAASITTTLASSMIINQVVSAKHQMSCAFILFIAVANLVLKKINTAITKLRSEMDQNYNPDEPTARIYTLCYA